MRRMSFASGAIVLIFALFGPPTAGASTISVSGVVHCHAGAVEGVWVQSSGGGSGFAGWKAFSPGSANATYSRSLSTRLPTTVQLHVGCGGSKAKWATSNYSPNRSVHKSSVLNSFCDSRGHCIWPAKGNVTTHNLGEHLQCTEGALNEWHAYTGFWPLWSGNAAEWVTTAAQNHYTVTTVAMPKSIVIFPKNSGNQFGHVAWVTSLSQSSSGAVAINVIEENYNGTGSHPTGAIRSYSYAANSSYRYIPAP